MISTARPVLGHELTPWLPSEQEGLQQWAWGWLYLVLLGEAPGLPSAEKLLLLIYLLFKFCNIVSQLSFFNVYF